MNNTESQEYKEMLAFLKKRNLLPPEPRLVPRCITHPDFAELKPYYIYHREQENVTFPHPEHLVNKYIIYRTTVTLDSWDYVSVNITADDYYKLYINGNYAGQGPASAWHDRYYYNNIEVTHWMEPGVNTIAVLTYYHGLICNSCVSGDLRHMLCFEMNVDGRAVLVSDESWRCGYHTGYSACGRIGYDVAFAECYDTRAREIGFEMPDFDDSYMGHAVFPKYRQWRLFPQRTGQLSLYDMEPEVLEPRPYGLYVALPTEAVGSLTFTARGNPGDVVVIRCGEELNADGSVRFDMRCNCRYEERMILSGGEDQMQNYDYKAFRYAELHFPPHVTVTDVVMQVRHYPFPRRYTYKTQNEKLRAVLDLCINTIHYGTQEHITDCPTREKGLYLGDLVISGKSQAILTGDTTFLKHSLETFLPTQIVCTSMITTAACGKMQEIADYALELPALLAWVWSVDHDTKWLHKMYYMIDGILNYFTKLQNADGLLEDVCEKWNLVDWPSNLRDGYDFPLTNPLQKGLGPHNVINALWYGFKLAAKEVCEILDKKRGDFGVDKAKEDFVKAFYNEELGLFTDTPTSTHASVQSNIFPLLFGMVDDPEKKERIIQFIRHKKLTSMGVYMAYFALAALKQEGRMDLCEELATDEGAWLNMIREGATVTFEVWSKDQKWNTSLFHPWATAPLIIFADHVRPY